MYEKRIKINYFNRLAGKRLRTKTPYKIEESYIIYEAEKASYINKKYRESEETTNEKNQS